MRLPVFRLATIGFSLCVSLSGGPSALASDGVHVKIINHSNDFVEVFLNGHFVAELEPLGSSSCDMPAGTITSVGYVLFKDGSYTILGPVSSDHKGNTTHTVNLANHKPGEPEKPTLIHHDAFPGPSNAHANDLPARRVNWQPSAMKSASPGDRGSKNVQGATNLVDVDRAYMDHDRTIFLKLTVPQQGRKSLKYTIKDPKYAAVLRHVQPILPGQQKTIQPWTED